MLTLVESCMKTIVENAMFPNKEELCEDLCEKLQDFRYNYINNILSENVIEYVAFRRYSEKKLIFTEKKILPIQKKDNYYTYVIKNWSDIIYDIDNPEFKLIKVMYNSNNVINVIKWKPIVQICIPFHNIILETKLPYLNITFIYLQHDEREKIFNQSNVNGFTYKDFYYTNGTIINIWGDIYKKYFDVLQDDIDIMQKYKKDFAKHIYSRFLETIKYNRL